MAPAPCSGLVVVLALVLCVPASAHAAECPPGSPTLVVTVNGKTSGPVYTTRDLLVRTRLSGGAFYGEAYGIADSPGTLTVTADLPTTTWSARSPGA